MNRLQRRKLAKRTGLSYQEVTKIQRELEVSSEMTDGTKVKLDVERMKASPRWENQNEKYVEFVENNVNTVFTVQKEEKFGGKPIVSLAEDEHEPKWLFYEGDLIKVEEECSE